MLRHAFATLSVVVVTGCAASSASKVKDVAPVVPPPPPTAMCTIGVDRTSILIQNPTMTNADSYAAAYQGQYSVYSGTTSGLDLDFTASAGAIPTHYNMSCTTLPPASAGSSDATYDYLIQQDCAEVSTDTAKFQIRTINALNKTTSVQTNYAELSVNEGTTHTVLATGPCEGSSTLQIDPALPSPLATPAVPPPPAGNNGGIIAIDPALPSPLPTPAVAPPPPVGSNGGIIAIDPALPG